MKEVTVNAWCDGNHEGERVPADIEVRIAVNGGQERLLDLCRDHDLELSALVLTGTRVKAVKGGTVDPSRGELGRDSRTCPECGQVSPTRSALGQHLRKMHSTTVRSYRRV